MKRKGFGALLSAAALASLAPPAHGGAIEEVMKLQRNGLWEMKVPGAAGKPMLFCVTDSTKIGGLAETLEAVKSLGCRTEKDSLRGDQYEIVLSCNHPDPNVGSFRMAMKGTARADYLGGTTVVTGGGPMIRSLFPSGREGGGENRWLRPCGPGEKPGLQESR